MPRSSDRGANLGKAVDAGTFTKLADRILTRLTQ